MKSLARWQSALLLMVPVLLSLGCEQRTATTASAAAPKGASGTTVGGSPPAPAQGAIRRGIDRQTAQNHLSQLGLFYLQYQTEMGRSPPNLQSFGEYIKRDAPQIYQALQENRYVVTWNANLSPNTVLAYEKDAYTDGSRLVMMGDRSIKIMNAQEFQQALQASGR